MAESKFLKWQDKDGDGLVDECNDLISVPEVNNCPPECYPNPYAIVPDWTTQPIEEPYLNEKFCVYHVVIETEYTSIIDALSGFPEKLDRIDDERYSDVETLSPIFNEYMENAT